MQAINWAGRIPRLASAMSPRLMYFAIGLGLMGVCAVIYGFHYRIQKKEQLKAGATAQIMTTDAATSNRLAVHGTPVPGATPASSLSGSPAASAQPSPGVAGQVADRLRGAVKTVAAPFGRPPQTTATNCEPLPTGQPDPSCQQPLSYPSFAPKPGPEVDPVVRMKAERRQHAYELRLAAIDAPTSEPQSGSSAPASRPMNQLQADLARLGSLPTPSPATTAAASDSLGYRHPESADDDPNQQVAKRAFQRTPEGDYLKTTRIPPISPWVVERGEVIPAGLPSQIVSDLPGDLVAEVKRDVYDTPTHRYVLIPAGSLLAGEYNSALSYGQKRVQVVWSYLRFPDGSYVDLDKFVGHGADGSTGLSDQVDNHIKRLVGGVALSSLFAAGLQISQNRTSGNSTLTYPSNTQLTASAVGQQAAELGQQITSRNLNVQPTVKIRPGEVFYVSVMKSIIFPGPYKPLEGSR
jgi:type IV secretory pathway VirB10-like protein